MHTTMTAQVAPQPATSRPATAEAGAPQPPALSDDLLRRMDRPGPRYTSYPTADRFVEAYTAEHYRQALTQRASGSIGAGGGPLSLYVHVPFCESVCYYCACNKIVTKDHGRAAAYIDALAREAALVTDVLGRGHSVTQLHFGGGTPTFLSNDEIRKLIIALDEEQGDRLDPRRGLEQHHEHRRLLYSFGARRRRAAGRHAAAVGKLAAPRSAAQRRPGRPHLDQLQLPLKWR